MLFPTAGTRFFVAAQPAEPGFFSMELEPAWVEVGETEAFGTLGGENEIEDFHDIGGQYVATKGNPRPVAMQLVLGLDPADPGQTLLLQAYHAREAYPFRMLFPDEVTERRWFALVTGLGEVFDAANNVMRLQADLHPVSPIQR